MLPYHLLCSYYHRLNKRPKYQQITFKQDSIKWSFVLLFKSITSIRFNEISRNVVYSVEKLIFIKNIWSFWYALAFFKVFPNNQFFSFISFWKIPLQLTKSIDILYFFSWQLLWEKVQLWNYCSSFRYCSLWIRLLAAFSMKMKRSRWFH